MTDGPTEVRIRAYNVGFGDSFLLTFRYGPGSERHLLMDFGTMGPPAGPQGHGTGGGPDHHRDCDEKLAVVAVSHRHADHISGFAGQAGRIIAGLDIDLVVQPWTERPDLAPTPPGRPAGARPPGPCGRRSPGWVTCTRWPRRWPKEAQRMKRVGAAGFPRR